ncbi:hypothetical protein DK59_2979 [Brucella abortus bv. 4 str. 292]|nr:hypothetical protein DK59_2979 [Brucella abortus bv. 4 str. 292]
MAKPQCDGSLATPETTTDRSTYLAGPVIITQRCRRQADCCRLTRFYPRCHNILVQLPELFIGIGIGLIQRLQSRLVGIGFRFTKRRGKTCLKLAHIDRIVFVHTVGNIGKHNRRSRIPSLQCHGILLGTIRMAIIFDTEFIVFGNTGSKVFNRLINRIELRAVNRIGRFHRDPACCNIGDGALGPFIAHRYRPAWSISGKIIVLTVNRRPLRRHHFRRLRPRSQCNAVGIGRRGIFTQGNRTMSGSLRAITH